jgi:hypothetical protein
MTKEIVINKLNVTRKKMTTWLKWQSVHAQQSCDLLCKRLRVQSLLELHYFVGT